MDVTGFENRRWKATEQSPEFRHRAATSLLREGPVLDIGCGDGLFLSLLKEQGIEGKGVDLSSEAVTACRQKGLDAEEWSGRGPLPYADGSFVCVTLLDVLEHVYDPSELIREAARVSRADVIIGVPNFSSLPARVQTLFGQVPENNRPHKGHVFWFNWLVLKAHIEAESLRIDETRMNTFAPFSLLGGMVERLFPNLFALSFVVRATKR